MMLELFRSMGFVRCGDRSWSKDYGMGIRAILQLESYNTVTVTLEVPDNVVGGVRDVVDLARIASEAGGEVGVVLMEMLRDILSMQMLLNMLN